MSQRKKFHPALWIAGFVLAVMVGFAAHPLLAKTPQDQAAPAGDASAPDVTPDTYRELNLFSEVFERVRQDYVKPVTDKELVESAVNGMLTSLDPHSSYMNVDEFKNMQVETQGEFGGLGIEVTMENQVIKVVSPIDDTPAAKAGLKPNDLIVAIDDQPVMGLKLNEAVQRLRGKPQSRVTLAVVRGQKKPFDVTLTRDIIRITSVKSSMKSDVGYLRINQFNEQTTENAQEALKKFVTEQGKNLKGLVLDLRNNPGGLLDQSISVGGLFLNNGSVVVSTKGRHAEDNETYRTDTDPIVPKDLPMVVLINSGSASAAEIVAGALQDHHRAMLLGTQSFGKGSVQTVTPIPGYGAIRLTTAYYFTPSGNSIQATGIKPNIEVHQKGEKDALTFHEADLNGALNNPNGRKAIHNRDLGETNVPGDDSDTAPDAKPVDGERDHSKDESVSNEILGDEKKDYQLRRALELVKGLSTYQNDDTSAAKDSHTNKNDKPNDGDTE